MHEITTEASYELCIRVLTLRELFSISLFVVIVSAGDILLVFLVLGERFYGMLARCRDLFRWQEYASLQERSFTRDLPFPLGPSL
jgi:hypothetical protein